jgi:hypothetical protein
MSGVLRFTLITSAENAKQACDLSFCGIQVAVCVVAHRLFAAS